MFEVHQYASWPSFLVLRSKKRPFPCNSAMETNAVQLPPYCGRRDLHTRLLQGCLQIRLRRLETLLNITNNFADFSSENFFGRPVFGLGETDPVAFHLFMYCTNWQSKGLCYSFVSFASFVAINNTDLKIFFLSVSSSVWGAGFPCRPG